MQEIDCSGQNKDGGTHLCFFASKEMRKQLRIEEGSKYKIHSYAQYDKLDIYLLGLSTVTR